MAAFHIRRRLHELVLDGLFVVLLAHFLATGTIAPTAIVELFRDRPPIVASSEPAQPPAGPPVESPLLHDSAAEPET